MPSASRPRPPPSGLRVGVGKPLIGRPGRLPRSPGGPRRKSPSAARCNPEPRPGAAARPARGAHARRGRRPGRWRRKCPGREAERTEPCRRRRRFSFLSSFFLSLAGHSPESTGGKRACGLLSEVAVNDLGYAGRKKISDDPFLVRVDWLVGRLIMDLTRKDCGNRREQDAHQNENNSNNNNNPSRNEKKHREDNLISNKLQQCQV